MRSVPVVLVVLIVGCFRGGFEPLASLDATAPGDAAQGERLAHDGSPSPADGLHKADKAPGPPASVTAANDDCSSPAVIDLGPVAAGGQVAFTVNTAGAKKDYDSPWPLICSGLPDVVAQLTSSPKGIHWTCNAVGHVTIAYSSGTAKPCPTSFTSSSTHPCDGDKNDISVPQGSSYIMICRDPAEGPVTITVSP